MELGSAEQGLKFDNFIWFGSLTAVLKVDCKDNITQLQQVLVWAA